MRDGVVIESVSEAVERAFARTAADLAPWPDPHPDRNPADDEYSRVTDAGRYRIIGARADAWADALVGLGLASIGGTTVEWIRPPRTDLSRTVTIVPNVESALRVVIDRHRLADVADAGLTLGAGWPADVIAWFPHCGCDACDSGSQDELDALDQHLLAIVTGTFRRLRRGDRVITVVGDSRSSSNIDRRRADRVLADPRGWEDISGTSWLPAAAGTAGEP
jgi:hypothetical protein